MIRAVIFDMGGVLVRSEDEQPRQQLADWLGISPEELIRQVFVVESAQRATVGEISEQQHWRNVQAHFGLKDEQMLEFQRLFWAGDRVDRALLNFIDGLRPQFRTALLSNAWDGARAVLTEKYQALSVFDETVFSAEVRLAKPDPAIYNLILGRLGMQPHETIFVDDFVENIEAAKELGIHAIRFFHPQQAMDAVQAALHGVHGG